MNYITNDTDLTTVADAIRTKGGTAASLTFPSGFATAIANIPSGASADSVISAFLKSSRGGDYHRDYNQPVVLDDSITHFGNYAFFYAENIPSIHFPNNLVELPSYCCSCCNSLTTVDLSNCTYLTTILQQAFYSCSSLQNVILPASVTGINSRAFANLTSATKIKFLGSTPPTISSNTFSNLPTTCVISVPTGSLSAYTSASNYPDPAAYSYIEE